MRLDVQGPVTLRAALDALEAAYPVLRGTIRDHATRSAAPSSASSRASRISRTSRSTRRCPRPWPEARSRCW